MRPTFVQRSSVLAIVAAMVPGIIQGTLGLRDTTSQFAMVSLGLIALALTTVGVAWAERRPTLHGLTFVLAADLAAVLGMMWLSQGRAFLASMPLVSLLVLYFPLGWALVVTAGLLTTILAVLPFDPTQLLASFGSAFVFVIWFIALQTSANGVAYQGYGAQGLGAQWFVDVKAGEVSDLSSAPITLTRQ